MASAKRYIGIDIGGTSIVAALFSDKELLDRSEEPTGADRPANEIMESLFTAVDRIINDQVVGIGVGMPGFMDGETGEVLLINNIPSFNGFSVKQAIVDKYGLPTFQSNDANCFALGETWYGSGKPFTNLVGITLGTGLGGGIIINRKIHTGLAGGAGELGCVPFHGGIVEDLASAALFKNKYNTDGITLYNRAKKGDAEALGIFEELAGYIAELMTSVTFILAPDAFVIGGSIANAWEFLQPTLRKEMDKFALELIGKNVQIVRAELDNAGLYGAAALCISQLG